MLAPSTACNEFQAIAHQESLNFTQPIVERLWVAVEGILSGLPAEEKLYFAGVAIERIAQALAERADWLLGDAALSEEEILQEKLGLPSVTVLDQFVGDRGSSLGSDWFDEGLLPTYDRKEREQSNRSESNPNEHRNIKNDLAALTKEKRIEECQEAIASFFKLHPEAISLSKLQELTGLPLVDVWLELLLGGYVLEQTGEFYDIETIFLSASQ